MQAGSEGRRLGMVARAGKTRGRRKGGREWDRAGRWIMDALTGVACAKRRGGSRPWRRRRPREGRPRRPFETDLKLGLREVKISLSPAVSSADYKGRFSLTPDYKESQPCNSLVIHYKHTAL